MKVKFDLDPTVPRVVIIAALLFIEAICLPAYVVLQQGRMPNDIEWMMFVVAAIIQVVTYLLSFLGTEPKEPSE